MERGDEEGEEDGESFEGGVEEEDEREEAWRVIRKAERLTLSLSLLLRAGAGRCASMRRQSGLLHKMKVEMNRGFAAKVAYKGAGRREERKSGAPCGGTFRRGQEE